MSAPEPPPAAPAAPATPDPKPTKGWPCIIVICVFAFVVIAVGIYLCWRSACLFESTDGSDAFLRGDGPAAGSLDGAADEHFHVLVTMATDGSRPSVKVRPPSGGPHIIPRFFVEEEKPKDDKDKGDKAPRAWKVVFVPPKPCSDHAEAIKATRAGWFQVPAGGGAANRVGAPDPEHGLRIEFALPTGSTLIEKEAQVISREQFDEKKKNLPQYAQAFEDFLKRGPDEKGALVRALYAAGHGGNAQRVSNLEPNDVKGTLGRLADDSATILAMTVPDGAGPARIEMPEFYFDAADLRWIGSIPHRGRNSRSVRVKLAVQTVPVKFRLDTFCTIPPPDMAVRFQIKTATAFAAQTKNDAWPVQSWLMAEDSGSLKPLFLIPVLQACRHNCQRDGNKSHPEVEKLAVAVLNNLGGQMGAIRARLGEIQNNGSYHYYNTYLYCEYVVALVHILKLIERVPLEKVPALRTADLHDLIKQAARVIADRVTADGYARYLHADNWDRSVGQVMLYSLQYVQLALAEDAGEDMKHIRGKLILLARQFLRHPNGVPYTDRAGVSGNLFPAYFQAAIALAQLGEITPAEFAGVLQRLNAHFQSSDYNAGIGAVEDAYRWMYWARVYELLVFLRDEPKTRERYFAGGASPPESLRTALLNMSAQLSPALGDSLKVNPQVTLSAYHAIGHEPVRVTMLAIAMESIWESVELPQAPGAKK